MSVNNIEALSSANRAYIENYTTKPKEEEKVVENEEVQEDNKLKKAVLALAALGAAAIGLYKCKNIISPKQVQEVSHSVTKLEDLKFENGIAKYKNSTDKFTGSVDLFQKKDKYTIEYLDGVLQKSTKHGEDAIVRTYSYTKDGHIASVDINGVTTDVVGKKMKCEARLEEISKLKKQIKSLNTEVSDLSSVSQKTDEQLLAQYEKEIELKKAELRLDNLQFAKRKLPEGKREVIEAELEKTENLRQEFLKKRVEQEAIEKAKKQTVQQVDKELQKNEAIEAQKQGLQGIKNLQAKKAAQETSKAQETTTSLLDTKGENKAIKSHHDVNGYNSNIRSDLKETGCSRMADKYDKEFESLEPIEKDFTVYRGRVKNDLIQRFNEDFDVIEKAQVGDIIVPDRGYSYTAMDKSLAQHWAGAIKPEDSMMYEIKLPKGAKVSRNLEHGGEVLMPRGAQYKLISKEKEANGSTKVVLEYILPEA